MPCTAKLIEDVERDPASRITEGDLQRRGVDPATVRRHFLRRYGMTFQAYTRSRRLFRAFTRIRGGTTLDDVIVTGTGSVNRAGLTRRCG